MEVEHLEKQLSSADNKLIELETENETMKLQTEKLEEQKQVFFTIFCSSFIIINKNYMYFESTVM